MTHDEPIDPLRWLSSVLGHVHRRPHPAIRFFVVLFGA
jgi:hypothetical protein